MQVSGQLYPMEKKPQVPTGQGWMEPRTGQDTVEKIEIFGFRRKSNPNSPAVQLVAICYTN
jgi:hypothetical protein